MSSKERIGIILDVEAEISKAKGNISSLSKIFDGIGGSKGNQLRDLLSDISAEYEKLANESGKTMNKVGDFTKAEKSSERLEQLLRRLNKEITSISRSSKSDLSKFFPPEVADRVKKASDAIKTYNTILENSGKKKGAIKAATDEYEKQEKAVRKAAEALKDLKDIEQGKSSKQRVTSDVQVKKQKSLTSTNSDIKQYSKELEEAQRAMDEFKTRKAELFARGTQNKSSEFRELRDNLAAAENNFKGATNKAAELRRELKNMVVVEDLDEDIKAAERALQDAQDAANKLKNNLNSVTADELARAFDEAKKKLEGLSGIDLGEITNIDDLNELLKRFTNDGVEGLVQSLSSAGVEIKELGSANDEAGTKIRNTTEDVEEQNRTLKDVSGLKTRILEFFSLTNAMQLARRGLQQTFETIKELDKAMTETAVVTDFSVGDMWDALPEYTKMANELGVATQGVYEASTLYYQQGLKTNEVMALTSETLKMARIAGLDCAEATDLMTAALRGFNMEINETNAQRINDVYSELAAITAADTQEIATAMTKTASIASSANMEFETTAALLSQIIETTREPAETAGTALKTIIARFTEMKKATSDLVNVDGETISVNKVEEALQSAGVALRDVNGEFRDLDDVFLELSSKWNGLDIMTQRYVATMAAGSRQQSRFIAMMQDYDRTVELVDAAYNSNGASANQFAKTQESLESKLAKLKNAWDEFLMGISNSKVIKIGVDALTGLLNIVNKLTGKSGILKLAVAIGALKGGAAIFNSLFKSLSKQNFSLESIGERIKNFKQTGSFSLKSSSATTDSTVASKQLMTGATSAAKLQVDGATKAGQILIKGATEAAKIETRSAKTEADIEKKGAIAEGQKENADAIAEGQKENADAIAEGQKENADAVTEGVTENTGATTENSIENAGATAESSIENAGATAEVVVENAGANAEAAIEIAGAMAEEAIESTAGSGGKGSKFLQQGGTWKDGFGKMWGNFKTGATAAFAALKPLLPLIGALAAEVAILGAIWYFSDEQVETRKLEEANKLAEGLSSGLEDARSALNSVTDGRSGLQSLKDELNELTVGTDEWKLKLLEVQAEEAKLIEQFDLKESMPDLENPEIEVNGLIQVDSAGNQTITDKGWEYLEKRQEDIVRTNLAASQIAQASADRQEFELEKVQTLEEKEDEVAKGDDVAGGIVGGVTGTALGLYGGAVGYSLGIAGAGAAMSALSGTALGAKLGGALGSVVPGLGTVIGLAVGALAGAAIGYAVNEGIEEVGGHGDEYKKAEMQLQKEQRVADQKQYMAYKNALKQSYAENKNLTAEEAEVAAAINASNMDQFIAAAEDEVGKKANKDEQKLWAQYKGYTWKDNKAYDADGNEIDLSDKKAIAKELAIFKAMDAAEQNAEVIAKYLQQGGEAIKALPEELGSSYEDFSKILSGDISANKETVDYMAKNTENNIDMAEEILKEAKTEEEKIQAIAAFTGKSEEDIRKEGNYEKQMAEALRVKALETQLNQLYAAQDFYAEMVYSGVASIDENGKLVYSAEIDVAGLDALDEKLSYEQMESISKISEGLRNALGKEGAGSKALYEALDTMTEDQIKETIGIFEGIDFSNPIRGANALNKALNSNEEAVRGLGQELLSISGDQYSIGSQFDYLMTSGIYDGFTEDIKELMEENGKLSAKNIREMAESSEELAMFLDQDGVSAHGLAKAFTLVEKEGVGAMKGLTTATIKALSTTRTLLDMYEEMQESVANFEPAPDAMAGLDWITESIETIQDMVDKGEFGNPQLQSYLEQIFAVDIGKDKKQIKDYFNKMKQYAKNEGAGFWQQVGKDGGIKGLLDLSNGLSNYILTEGTTTEQLLKAIQDQYNLTIEGAEYFLGSLTAHSIDLSNQLNFNDGQASIGEVFQTRATEMGADETGENVVITQSEIDTITHTYNIDDTAAKEKLENLAKEKGLTLTIVPELVDEQGNPLTGQALTDKLKELGGEGGMGTFMIKTEMEMDDGSVQEIIDYLATKELLIAMGLNEEEADAQIQTYIDEHKGTQLDIQGRLFSTTEDAQNFATSVAKDITPENFQEVVDALETALAGCNITDLISTIQTKIKEAKYELSIAGKVELFLGDVWQWIQDNFENINWQGVITPVGGYAKGSDGLPRDEVALTGEEGAELVQSADGTAHLVGVNGPEMTALKKGDVIYPADETKKILNGHSPKKVFPRYANGTKMTKEEFQNSRISNRYRNYDDYLAGRTGHYDTAKKQWVYDYEAGERNSKMTREEFKNSRVSNRYNSYEDYLAGKTGHYDNTSQTWTYNNPSSGEITFGNTSSGATTGEITYPTSTGEDGGKEEEEEKAEKLNSLQEELNRLKERESEIDSAISDLQDNEIYDASKIVALLKQKRAVQKDYLAKLRQENALRKENENQKLTEAKEKGYEQYFQKDEETGLYELTERFYNELFTNGIATDTEKVNEIMELVEQLNTVSSGQLQTELEIERLVADLTRDNAENYNAERKLVGAERRQNIADQEESLINRLPQEIQGPLLLANSLEDAWITYDTTQATRTLIDNKSADLQRNYETLPEEYKQFLNFNEFDGFTIDEEGVKSKYSGQEATDMLDALEQFAIGFNEDYDEIYELKESIGGGKIQKAFHSISKVSKEFAKDLNKDEKTISKAFRELGEDINFGADQLEGFGLKAEELIGDMDFKGITDQETAERITEKIKQSKIGNDIFSEEGFAGIQQLLTGGKGDAMLGAFGDVFGDLTGFAGDMFSFDMMGIGMDMFDTAQGMIDQGKQMIEKIIGYITQATQAIVDAWTNREDYLYNFLQIIEKHLNEYEKLQRYQNQIEKGRTASVDDIKNNWEQQWKSLQQQLEEQTERLETRQQELDRSRWNPFSLISGWDPSTDTLYENRTVKFAWDLAIGLGEAFAPFGTGAFFSQLNQLYEDYDKRVQDSYEDRLAAEQAILDIEDQRLELVKVGAEQATEFEQRILDAMIQKEQEQIDELTRLNDTITDANSKLISTLQSNLEKMRQERQNEKTEEELGEKERRLAYLRQDTSGANRNEILKLEEELEKGHEDYTDQLIDQKISELEKQNELAAEQRQQQIELLQGQLDYAEKYGLYWDAIYGMLYTFDENGNPVLNPENFDLDGNIRENSQLAQLLGTFSDRLGMSVWSSVLDAEELKTLGKYYGAFIEYNGVDGNWKNQWALDNPRANDPNYAYPEQEIPGGLWGVLYKLEIGLKKMSINNNPDIINRFGRMGEWFKNAFGKLFGNEEWANYKYEPTSPAHVESTFFAGLKGIGDSINEWFKNGFSKISSNAKTISMNTGGTQNYGDSTINNNFNIGSVGESIGLDDLTDKITGIFRDLFSTGNNLLKIGH